LDETAKTAGGRTSLTRANREPRRADPRVNNARVPLVATRTRRLSRTGWIIAPRVLIPSQPDARGSPSLANANPTSGNALEMTSLSRHAPRRFSSCCIGQRLIYAADLYILRCWTYAAAWSSSYRVNRSASWRCDIEAIRQKNDERGGGRERSARISAVQSPRGRGRR